MQTCAQRPRRFPDRLRPRRRPACHSSRQFAGFGNARLGSRHSPDMPTLTIALVLTAATAASADSRIVVMADPADATALQIALAGRGIEVIIRAEPDGELRLDRAAL